MRAKTIVPQSAVQLTYTPNHETRFLGISSHRLYRVVCNRRSTNGRKVAIISIVWEACSDSLFDRVLLDYLEIFLSSSTTDTEATAARRLVRLSLDISDSSKSRKLFLHWVPFISCWRIIGSRYHPGPAQKSWRTRVYANVRWRNVSRMDYFSAEQEKMGESSVSSGSCTCHWGS